MSGGGPRLCDVAPIFDPVRGGVGWCNLGGDESAGPPKFSGVAALDSTSHWRDSPCTAARLCDVSGLIPI